MGLEIGSHGSNRTLNLGGNPSPFSFPSGQPSPYSSPVNASPTNLSQGPLLLRKGERISLTKDIDATLDEILIGLGWDVGDNFDLDVSAIEVDGQNRTAIGNFVCYDSDSRFRVSQDGALRYHGDSRTGEGSGYDEKIDLTLSKIAPPIQKIIVVVHIYQSHLRGQNFRQVRNAFIALEDKRTNHQIIRYNLTEEYSEFAGVEVAEIYRYGNEWKFNPLGRGINEDLETTLSRYGL